jgi:Anti-sigma-K factor rskA
MPDDRFVEALTDHLDDPRGQADSPSTSSADGVTDDAGPDFEALVAELRQESTWTGPPAGLRASILATVVQARAEHEAPPAEVTSIAPVEEALAVEETPAETSQLDEVRARRARRSRAIWGLAAVAAVAAAFAAGVLTTDGASTPTQPPGRQYLAAGSSLDPSASATVTVAKGGAGFSVQLDLHNLPPAAPGSYYAAWLRGPEGLVSIGTFHGRRTGPPFKLWSGVDPARYPQFVVTLQSEGGPTGPSDRVMLRGTLG